MLKNNKGTILVVAVTAMMILIVIGYVCLQMYMNQSILDTYDSLKQRLFYSAEGAIRATIGYINTQTPADDRGTGARGYLFNTGISGYVNNSGNVTSSDGGQILVNNHKNILSPFDGTMHPKVNVIVSVRRLTATTGSSVNATFRGMVAAGFFNDIKVGGTTNIGTNFINAISNTPNGGTPVAYEIAAKATATHKTALHTRTLSTTVHCYFYSQGAVDASTGAIARTYRIVAWRVD